MDSGKLSLREGGLWALEYSFLPSVSLREIIVPSEQTEVEMNSHSDAVSYLGWFQEA